MKKFIIFTTLLTLAGTAAYAACDAHLPKVFSLAKQANNPRACLMAARDLEEAITIGGSVSLAERVLDQSCGRYLGGKIFVTIMEGRRNCR